MLRLSLRRRTWWCTTVPTRRNCGRTARCERPTWAPRPHSCGCVALPVCVECGAGALACRQPARRLRPGPVRLASAEPNGAPLATCAPSGRVSACWSGPVCDADSASASTDHRPSCATATTHTASAPNATGSTPSSLTRHVSRRCRGRIETAGD
jgi:hypothetical protein